jgi:microcystin-dependent protein
MSELSGVLSVSVNNSPGYFHLSENSQGVLFYALALASQYRNWLSSPLDELTDADKAQIDDLIEFATYEVMNMIAINPVGNIALWLTDTPPDRWLVMNGQVVSRTDYAELFALYGETFGAGDGTTTFSLPDMRSLHPKGAGGLIGLGEVAGSSVIHVSVDQLPTHNHGINDPGHTHQQHIGNNQQMKAFVAGGSGTFTPAGAATSSSADMLTASRVTGITTQDVGLGDAISTAQPSIGVHYIVYAGG